MISNPGFNFSNINGKFYIDSIENTDMDNVDPLYSEAIICKEIGKLVPIYTDEQKPVKDSESIAFKFAKINIANNDEILVFCNQYGLPMSERNFANFRNDYLFFEKNKDEFTKMIPLVHKERERLTDIKKSIVDMRLLLNLSAAIEEHDYNTIVEIITFFCLDLTVHDYDGSRRNTELFQFNHAFYRYAEFNGYKPFKYQDFDFTSTIYDLLDALIADEKLEQIYNYNGQPFPRRFRQYDFSEWRHIKALFEDILSEADVKLIDPFGKVTFSKPISEINYFKQLSQNNLLNLAKAALSDLFKEKLITVFPEIQFEKGKQTAGWRIPTFIDAMYLELFFRFSPNVKIKRCADPTCRAPFEWSPSKPNQIYCDNVCAVRMAKRMQRARNKQKNSE